MRTEDTGADGAFRQKDGEGPSGIQDAQPVFAVLALERWGNSPSADRITALCEGIPGVEALRVDADRGRIHLLYDGTAAAIEQVENAVRISGHRIRLLGDRTASLPRARAGKGSA